ncbi:DNA recombination protein RmuC [Candidatus Falkowbacteria bacterium]|uniref:DNA recombination protein RmuC n=1 Tax=Candidatus Buchananbacteria bacterium CG10_big_fil_rev_8_21_14_0_10_33_19 TaxID=1974525 RepID=A0A2H0W3C2_9BACT|nr:DNA recombination protein RmuC [Candidatus Falkowbacteria bacterium]PIS05862.1 MAG: DNA recombination protein RmuC [Candidatus Buchananbacteria bacterium CG10_big_fil_rev_8_21_14_0_10_33_19]
MEAILVILILFIVFFAVAVGGLFLFFNKKFTELQASKKDDQSFLMLQERIKELNQTMDVKLSDSTRQMQTQFSHSLSVIKDVAEKAAQIQETNKQVKDFSQQLFDLKRVLTSQKQRGNLGEAGLHLVLENILPPSAYQFQYKINDGAVVDAAIFTKDGVIPVDAKFSLENYNRIVNEDDEDRRKQLEKEFKNDLKKRIDETAKYIQPNKGTMDFAFMFIPAEAIYYDLLVNEVGAVKVDTGGLIDYAFKEKKVIIVSPTTFAAYLQTVLQGLRALKIEGQAKDIIKNVEKLQRHLISYDDRLQKLGNSLNTTVNAYNISYKEFNKIDKDIVKITDQESKIDILEIDNPRFEK